MQGSSRGGKEWLAPLTGAAFFVIGLVTFLVGGQPKSADKPVNEVVQYYLDHQDRVQISAAIGIVAGLFLIFFGAYLRKVLDAASAERSSLPIVAFIGLVIVAISFALADRADDIAPSATQALQALYDDDFFPIVLGVMAFLWGTGLSVVRTGVLPKWLGWVMIVLGVITPTPIGFIAALAAAVLVLVISVLLSVRARSAEVA
jgi:hypothetical protein